MTEPSRLKDLPNNTTFMLIGHKDHLATARFVKLSDEPEIGQDLRCAWIYVDIKLWKNDYKSAPPAHGSRCFFGQDTMVIPVGQAWLTKEGEGIR